MQGTFSQICLTDVLQLCILGKKSGLLRLAQGNENVEIHFSQGDVLHAKAPCGEGEKAFFYPLTWVDGTFALIKDASTPARTIQKSSEELLNELMALWEEWEQVRAVIPTESSAFRIAESDNQRSDPITISPDQWRILSRINGARSVRAIADTLHLPYFDVAKAIYGFHREGLVEIVSGAAKILSNGAPKVAPEAAPSGFLDRMVHRLAEVSGPIASVVVRDQIAALGGSPQAFPKSRLPELIESVSQQIPDKKLKARFQQKINEDLLALKIS